MAQSAGQLTDVTPKPKKFFKSRNSAPETDLAIINAAFTNANDHKQPATPATPNKVSAKVKKEQRKKEEKPKQKPEKPEKPEKPAKAPKKKAKNEEKTAKKEKPTRVLSRTRKAINYSEDKSRSASPVHVPPTEAAQSSQPVASEPPPILDEAATNPSASPSKNLIGDHPPIVLRISKVSVVFIPLLHT